MLKYILLTNFSIVVGECEVFGNESARTHGVNLRLHPFKINHLHEVGIQSEIKLFGSIIIFSFDVDICFHGCCCIIYFLIPQHVQVVL